MLFRSVSQSRYVKSWDVVNEAISGGGDDGEGFYVLQSASNGDPLKNFYWQDYLGSEEYVRKVVGMARKYYAEFKGNPSDWTLAFLLLNSFFSI